MEYVYLSEQALLDYLSEPEQSHEDFLCELEDKLDSGEMTESEVYDLLQSFHTRSR